MEAEFLTRVATVFKLNKDQVEKIWELKPDIYALSVKYTLPYEDVLNIWKQVETEFQDEDDYVYETGDAVESQVAYSEQQHMFNESAITLKNYGLMDMSFDNIYTVQKLKLIEGEDKFFLRQLINSYNFLKYQEKINVAPHHFKTVYEHLKHIPFHTKKSPPGLLLGNYVYDKTKIINMDKLYAITKIKKGGAIPANLIIPMTYNYKVYVSDVLRYAKMFHKLLDEIIF
jgi:hypothetical protein